MNRSAAAAAALALAFSCKPVEGTPIPSGPLNICGTGPSFESCDLYTLGQTATSTHASCATARVTDTVRRCDLGPPTFSYTVVVDVPDSSFYAPGRTFQFTSIGQPSNPQCSAGCIQLASLFSVSGQYTITPAVATLLGLSVNGSQSMPVQARYIPFGPGDDTAEALTLGLPVPDLYTTSQFLAPTPGAKNKFVVWQAAVIGGDYQRIFYPEPPFDAFLPPAFSPGSAPVSVEDTYTDSIAVGTAKEAAAGLMQNPPTIYASLDDESGDSRRTTITRTDGLDGWQVWIQQHATARRISTIKTLSGTTDSEILHTIGFRQNAAPALVDNVDLVVSPPATYLAMPQLVSPIINGAVGLKNVEFPMLPVPVRYNGFVVSTTVDPATQLPIGQPSSVAFTSTGLLRTTAESATATSDPTLHYSTVVSTDGSGQFTTVLPQGTYDVLVSPIEGTGFARYRTTIDTAAGLSSTFRPPLRTVVTGQAILADGRPLSEATVHAEPSGFPLKGKAVSPRPTVTRTDSNGFFSFEADQGEYNFMIDPQLGTGFPRLVQDRTFDGDMPQDLGQIVVPLGARFPLTIKDPSGVANPIAYAVVRVFAEYPDNAGPPAVEIGTFTTDATGYAEISLIPPTR